ncbi:T9SS type A sorting domain-containing protein [Flavobacterium sp. SM2513]|uniref:T9SS type A sorting domain-containing protein n=1 Tax=Flavobacterium sp. SM2513 TaxID=3424766 RepID=UPI003D7F3B6F
MKKLYTLFFLTTLNFSFAQDPQIFNNTWYLHNVIVNGADTIPPNSNMILMFSPTNLSTNACNSLFGPVVFENNTTQFSFSNYSITLNLCEDADAAIYQEIYFPVFTDGIDSSPAFTSYFTYSISETEGVKTLIINSAFNKQAIYSDVALSTSQFNKESFSFYPNPSEDFIEINLNNSFTKSTTLEIYNNIGILQKTEHLTNTITQVDINNLATGVYYLKITSETGTSVKKLIKK